MPRRSATSSGDPRGGYAYSRIGNPTTAALGAAYAELAGGEPGAALASGMGAIHAALASRVRSGDRIVASRDLYGSTRSPAARHVRRVRGRGRPRRRHRPRRGRRGPRGATDGRVSTPSPSPTRRPSWPTTPGSPSSPTGTARRTSSTTRSPARTSAGRWTSARTSSSNRRPSSSAATATSSPASSPDRPRPWREVDRVQIETGATLGPLDAFLVLRGILTLGVRASATPRTAAALAAWLETSARRAARPLSGPRQPSAARRRRPPVPRRARSAACSPLDVAGGREAGKAVIDAMTLPELTASLGSVHTMVVHPPSTSQRQLLGRRPRGGRDHAGPVARLGRVGRPGGPAGGLLGGPGRGAPGRARARRRLRDPDHRHTDRALGCLVPPGPAEPARPAGPGPVAPADLGRLRGRPDHRHRAARDRRDDASSSCPTSPSARPRDYGLAMDQLHLRYDALLGPGVVDVLERLERLPDVPLGRGSAPPWSCWSSRSSCARSIGRRGCGGAWPRSGSPSPSRTSTRSCRTAPR